MPQRHLFRRFGAFVVPHEPHDKPSANRRFLVSRKPGMRQQRKGKETETKRPKGEGGMGDTAKESTRGQTFPTARRTITTQRQHQRRPKRTRKAQARVDQPEGRESQWATGVPAWALTPPGGIVSGPKKDLLVQMWVFSGLPTPEPGCLNRAKFLSNFRPQNLPSNYCGGGGGSPDIWKLKHRKWAILPWRRLVLSYPPLPL